MLEDGRTLIVHFEHIGEGYNGDYNPSDPLDEQLVRISAYTVESRLESVEDGSICTQMVASHEADYSQQMSKAINDIADKMNANESIKRTMDELSWLRLEET